jgi:dTDP-4-amino-4,6-dideoxygalactose transaminase
MPPEPLDTSIPVMWPRLPTAADLAPYLARIDAGRVYSNWGPLVAELSERLAGYFGVEPDQVAVLANGTLALKGAVETVGGVGDTWHLPSWTFAATGHAVVNAGRHPHFVDVDRDTWAAEPCPAASPTGHMVVAPFGARPEAERWFDSRCPVVFDAASCFDSCQGIGESLGPTSALMVSLHATKALAAGEGGVLVGPAAWIDDVVAWANFGFHHDRVVRIHGTNAKLSEYHAAVALASLDRWSTTRAEWAEVIDRVVAVSAELGVGVQPALGAGWVTTTWICEMPDPQAKHRLERECDRQGIGYRNWWGDGTAMMPYFIDCDRDPLPATASLAERTIGLPLFLGMTAAEIERVGAAIAASLAG